MQENEIKVTETAAENTAAAEESTQTLPTAEQAAEINAANAATSTGKISDDGQGAAFFTASDVRAMSRTQVRRNLTKILKSMESDEF